MSLQDSIFVDVLVKLPIQWVSIVPDEVTSHGCNSSFFYQAKEATGVQLQGNILQIQNGSSQYCIVHESSALSHHLVLSNTRVQNLKNSYKDAPCAISRQ